MPRELDLPRSESELNELFLSSAAYRNSAEFAKMMRFIARRSRIAPFNAYLLYIQKPDIVFAASRTEWSAEGRSLKEGARPLIILKPFAPVEFVYDAQDTEGLGDFDAEAMDNWKSKGIVSESEIAGIVANMEAAGLCMDPLDLKELKLRYRVPVPFVQARRDQGRRLQGLRPGAGK
ncbi:MAG: LtrC-like protein, partial [Spirochaetes bacterium]